MHVCAYTLSWMDTLIIWILGKCEDNEFDETETGMLPFLIGPEIEFTLDVLLPTQESSMGISALIEMVELFLGIPLLVGVPMVPTFPLMQKLESKWSTS